MLGFRHVVSAAFVLGLPVVVAIAAGACGSPPPAAPPTPSAAPAASSSAPAPRPMASSAVQAQTLIQDQIDANTKALGKCVEDYRTGVGDPHRPVIVDIGIDQEGRLLGVVTVKPKPQETDTKLKDCMWASLHGLPFPRSHSGVITIRQTFTDTQMQP